MHREIVVKRAWLEQMPFTLSYALSRLTPGTNLLAFCTAAGFIVRGWTGALVALMAASVPCSFLAVVVTYVYESWARHPLTMIGLRGALAAAVGIMFVTCWQLARPHFQKAAWLKFLVLIGGSFVLASYFAVAPLRVLLLAAVAGWFWPARPA